MTVPACSSAKKRVSGVILIDKPIDTTSQQVVSKVKYLFKSPQHDSKKAGHTGTLDPMATGLLPVCLGDATKFSHYQLDADKSYEALIKLGERTDTGDADGKIIETCPIPHVEVADCQRLIKQFLGEQSQIPPMYSALKKAGKKLYEYAREGIEVPREPRPITIHQLQLQMVAADTLKLQVRCSKGTYVRVLAEDIAKALGSVGHLISLRRLQVGDFLVSEAICLDTLEQLSLAERFEQLRGVDACIAHLPSLTLTDDQWRRVLMGQRLNVRSQFTADIIDYLTTDEAMTARDIRLVSLDNVFIGLGMLETSGRLQPKKILPV